MLLLRYRRPLAANIIVFQPPSPWRDERGRGRVPGQFSRVACTSAGLTECLSVFEGGRKTRRSNTETVTENGAFEGVACFADVDAESSGRRARSLYFH